MAEYYEIQVFDFFSSSHIQHHNLILVILNSDTNLKNSQLLKDEFRSFWKHAALKASVDGATNLIHEMNLTFHDKNIARYFIPDLISGDFDSIDPTLLNKYQDWGSYICKTTDQNHTDFTKCLKVIGSQYCAFNKYKKVVALSYSVSDRFDQVMANINSLYEAKTLLPSYMQTCLLSPNSCSYILDKGYTKLVIDTNYSGCECSIMPISNGTTVTTHGFISDFTNTYLEIGEVSSFSRMISKTCELITVITDNILLFSISRKSRNHP